MTHSTEVAFQRFYSNFILRHVGHTVQIADSTQYKDNFGCQSAILLKCFLNMGVQNSCKITCSVQEVNYAGGLKPNFELISTREEPNTQITPHTRKISNLRFVLKPWEQTFPVFQFFNCCLNWTFFFPEVSENRRWYEINPLNINQKKKKTQKWGKRYWIKK